MKRITLLFTLTCSLLLGGCATTFTSQVSVFHEWPDQVQDKSFILERSPGQENNPEHNIYEQMLRTRLQNLGFKEVAAGATPAMKVELQYATTLREIQYSPLWQPGIYDPYWGMHFSRGIYRHRLVGYPFGYPYYWGWPGYPRGWIDVRINSTYLHQLEIRISEMTPPKKLADIKVSTEQFNPEIAPYIPYMMDSAFKEFPGKNGSTSKVELKLE